MRYNVDSFEELIDYFRHQGERKRDEQTSAKKVAEKNVHGAEAATYEYVVMVLESCNLRDARFIMVDGEIEDAVRELEMVQIALGTAAESLNLDVASIAKKITELKEIIHDNSEV